MDFTTTFANFESTYDEAVARIIELREMAQEIKDSMDAIIDSCEIIENEF